MNNIVWAVIDIERGIVALCSTGTNAARMADEYVNSNYPVDTIERCENVEIRSIELDKWMDY